MFWRNIHILTVQIFIFKKILEKPTKSKMQMNNIYAKFLQRIQIKFEGYYPMGDQNRISLDIIRFVD